MLVRCNFKSVLHVFTIRITLIYTEPPFSNMKRHNKLFLIRIDPVMQLMHLYLHIFHTVLSDSVQLM